MKALKRLLLIKKTSNSRFFPYFFKKSQPSSFMQSLYQNWICVLDPVIALSHYGVLIAENMGKEIELWVVRELWNIVNNAEFYSQKPELVTPQNIINKKNVFAAETTWSLKEWKKTKQEKDLARLGLYWLGDNLQESLLPINKPIEFFGQWEASASALDKRNEQIVKESDVLTLALRDTLALAASLKSAFVLTYQPPTDFAENSSPTICEVLKNWGISYQVFNKRNPIVAIERQYIRQLVIRAGLGKLLLAGVNLAVFHLVLPAITTSDNLLSTNTEIQTSKDFYLKDLEQESYFWSNVKGILYYL
jgi:hypothetical protein